MPAPAIPMNEEQRLNALASYDILDSLPEADYERIVRLAAYICQTPAALINLIDRDRQWTKSALGNESSEVPREESFCAHTILEPASPLVVEDARTDERFADNPHVQADDSDIVFYAGVPILSPEGYALGSLCVLDNKPRQLTAEQMEALQDLNGQLMTLFELRKTRMQLAQCEERMAAIDRA